MRIRGCKASRVLARGGEKKVGGEGCDVSGEKFGWSSGHGFDRVLGHGGSFRMKTVRVGLSREVCNE